MAGIAVLGEFQQEVPVMAAMGQVIDVSWNNGAISPRHDVILQARAGYMNQKIGPKIESY